MIGKYRILFILKIKIYETMARRQVKFNKIELLVTCPITGDIARRPVISKCCHTVFDRKSVEGLSEKGESSGKRCPKCSSESFEFEKCPFAETIIRNLFF